MRALFNFQTKTITSAALVLAVSSLISRILGLFRDRLLASTFGAGQDLDVYYAAFRIPDFIYSILIAGGIIVAFLPLMSEYFLEDKEKAWKFTNNILNIFLLFLILVSLGLFIFAPTITKLITPGFNDQQVSLTILLTRVLALSPIFLGVSSVFSGILQYFSKFLAYGLAPIFYNLGIILGILFLAPTRGILGVVIGVVLGAFMHLAVQIPSAIMSGFKYRPVFDIKEAGLRRVLFLMIPRTFAVFSLQSNYIVMTAIASTLAAGSISIFNLANNIQHFPSGIIGVSFATAAFPILSRFWADEKKEEFARDFFLAIKRIICIILPITLFMFIFRNQIVEIIFRQGEFTQASAQLTASALGLFCLGILPFSLVPLLSRAFFSFQDTRTPTLITLATVVLNISLSLYFVDIWKEKDAAVLGLPLAFSLSAIFNFKLLMFFLRRRLGYSWLGWLKKIWLA